MNDSFKNLNIADFLLEPISKMEISTPTQVQQEAIPLILGGEDVIIQSPTGTGKTLAYLLPIFSRLQAQEKNIQALILAPTRELAVQITNLAKSLGTEQNISSLSLLGGANIKRQLESLKVKPQVVVGTPGRILELIKLRKINTQTIRFLVVDEADKMWAEGFKSDIEAIAKSTLKDRQTVLVSATISPELVAAAITFMSRPATINLSQENQLTQNVKHLFFSSTEKNKAELLKKLLIHYKPKKAIVFINSNKGVIPFTRRFADFGFKTIGLHSQLNPQERKNVLQSFRSGKSQVLVTTDLFSRGMDIAGVEIVFNFDLPPDPLHYIHRAGRTGRGTNKGIAISFVTPEQKFIISKYEDHLDTDIPECGLSDTGVFQVRKR